MKTIFFFSLLCNSFFTIAQTIDNTRTEKLIQKIDSLVQKTIIKNDIPALSISLIHNGNIFLEKGYGTIKRNSDIKVNLQTIYQIASLSKMFTGIIAKSLVAKGQLNLESSIINYLPKNLSKKTINKLRNIKVVDLLLHQSGFPRDSKVVKRKDGEPMTTGYTDKDLKLELEKLKLRSKPNKKFEYSNVGYAAIGYILEKASNLSYQELLEKYLIEEFKLKNTSSIRNTSSAKLMAVPYRKESSNLETKHWVTGKFVSASGIYSSVSDLSKIMVNQLNAYKNSESNTVSSQLILTEIKCSRGNDGSYYGLGLFEDKTDRGILYGHRGDMDGFASEYSFNVDRNTGVILLTSSGGKWIGLLSAQISKILESNE